MPIKKYAKGYRLELKFKHKFEEQKAICIRSAGSKGAIDLAIFKDGKVLLLQVKTKKPTKWEIDKHKYLEMMVGREIKIVYPEDLKTISI